MVIINSEANTEKFVVVQSNDLVEAMYSPALTARAHKVARLLFSLISPEDKDLKLYTITIEALKRYLGYKTDVTWGRFNDDLRDIADRLNREPIVIKTAENIITAYMIAGFVIDYKKATVTFEIPLLLKPFLLELKRNFTMYPLLYIPKLKSSYSIRLYELLYQYKTIGHRTFEIADLQKKVGSDYELYGDFKRKVLGIAQRDLEEHTDIRFEFDEIKTVRKVSSLKFRILANTPKQTPEEKQMPKNAVLSFLEEAIQIDDKPDLGEKVRSILRGWEISDKSLQKFGNMGFNIITDDSVRVVVIERTGGSLERYYLEKIEVVNNGRPRGVGEATNRAGFLVKALQEDWQSPKAVQEQQEKDVKRKRQNVQKRLKELENTREVLKKQLEADKSALYELISQDSAIFLPLFESAKSGVTTFRETIFPNDMTPIACFQKGGMSRNLIALKMEEAFPERFVLLNDHVKKQLTDIDTEIESLKKM